REARRRRPMIVLVVACFPRGDLPPDTVIRPVLVPPQITALDLACDVEGEKWTLSASASSWTGGGTLWFTEDGEYVEKHTVRTKSAEPDGSAETLGADIGIVSDWR